MLEPYVNKEKTIEALIRWAETEFIKHDLYFGHGSDNALDEAAYLVLYALHLPPQIEEHEYQRMLNDGEIEAIHNLIEQRIESRKPAAYLTHEAWFCGLKFYIDERVLVPRSPIAELIINGFAPWLNADIEPGRILDLGTGSGCIAIACAYAFPHVQVDAVDISLPALEVAKINIRQHQLQQRVKAVQSDLFQEIGNVRYDLIVSNPPYVGEEELSDVPREYEHEPKSGLAGGNKGVDIVVRILSQAVDYLMPDGLLIVEVGNSQDVLVERFPQVPFLWLEFEHGGHGVFLITAEQLIQSKNYLL